MRIPRDLSGMELVKALCRDWDYRVVHQEGSHIILQTDTPTHQRLSMPSHNPLRVGTLNAIALAPAWFVRARQEDMGQVRLRRGYGGTSAVRPGRAMRPAHPARLAPVRHRSHRRLGAPRLAGRHRPHATPRGIAGLRFAEPVAPCVLSRPSNLQTKTGCRASRAWFNHTNPVRTRIRCPITKTCSRIKNHPLGGWFGGGPLPGSGFLPARSARRRHPCRATFSR